MADPQTPGPAIPPAGPGPRVPAAARGAAAAAGDPATVDLDAVRERQARIEHEMVLLTLEGERLDGSLKRLIVRDVPALADEVGRLRAERDEARACRAANATFNRTRARAVQRLIEAHQDEYRALLAEERAAGGT